VHRPKYLEPTKEHEKSSETKTHGVVTPVKGIDQHQQEKTNQDHEEGEDWMRPHGMRLLAPAMPAYGFGAEDGHTIEVGRITTFPAGQIH
jgi:hypothetical protein